MDLACGLFADHLLMSGHLCEREIKLVSQSQGRPLSRGDT